MRVHVEGNKIAIVELGAEEARAMFGALRAAVGDYKRRAKQATSAADFCLAPPRRKPPEMRARAAELHAEAAAYRSLAAEANTLARKLIPALRSKAVR